MKIEHHSILIKELFKGYIDNAEDGVRGYDNKLDIRPKYQREFIYKDKQREAVIRTIRKNFPLNVMYWVENPITNEFEVMDGQQRTISICSYLKGDYSIDYQYFHNLTRDEQEQILNYELLVYICKGTDKEKLDWFKIINIAGEKLTDQELRNAVYTGEWLIDAKKHFSKTNCPAWNIAKQYMSGSPIRQDYLEKTLEWISSREGKNIEDYMSVHQQDNDASELWQYFQEVISWVERIFPNYRNEMKGLNWGIYYNKYKNNQYNSKTLEERIEDLMLDDDITNKKGIYEYLLSSNEKHLNIRAFSPKMKREAFERQKGICPSCKEIFKIDEMEADHIDPWSKGGRTSIENCQMLCKPCNRRKSNM